MHDEKFCATRLGAQSLDHKAGALRRYVWMQVEKQVNFSYFS